MSVLDLGDVLNEVLLEKARVLTVARGQTPGAKLEIYTESWGALNNWIESRLCVRKGASIPMLGAFTWEIKYGGDGNVYSRPIFVMSDSFLKEHRIRRQRVHQPPNVVPPEEINYSKLAIRFSRALTKDMIFTGTRDIIKKIGDFVDRSLEFDIDFPFGTLKCKERAVRFEFNQARLAAILPESLRIGTLPQQQGGSSYDAMSESERTATYSQPSMQGANQQEDEGAVGLTVSARGAALGARAVGRSSSAPEFEGPGRKIPPLKLGLALNPPGSASAAAASSSSSSNSNSGAGYGLDGERGSDRGGGMPPIYPPSSPARYANTALDLSSTVALQAPASSDDPSHDLDLSATSSSPSSSSARPRYSSATYTPACERPISPGLQAVLLALEEHTGVVDKTALRDRAKARVEEAAYLKALEAVADDAHFEETVQGVAAAMQDAFEDGLKARMESFHSNKKTVKKDLFEQIDEVEARRAVERQAQRDMKAAFFLPPSAGCIENPPGCLDGGPNYTSIKESLHRDLTYQIRTNEQRAQTHKRQAMQEEKAYLDHVAMELDLQNIAERVSHLQKQKTLLASWERDAHIRNLRKLQVAGPSAVQDYISINLPDAAEAEKTQKAFSIGYDFRKGKK